MRFCCQRWILKAFLKAGGTKEVSGGNSIKHSWQQRWQHQSKVILNFQGTRPAGKQIRWSGNAYKYNVRYEDVEIWTAELIY